MFKRIEGENYEVDEIGQVRNYSTKKILSPFKKEGGYLRVQLGVKGNSKRRHFVIHRLVAKAFIPNPNNLPQVNHKDGNKLNNHVDNLEWVTAGENIKHSFKLGLQIPLYGEDHQNTKLKDRDLVIIKRILYLIDKRELNTTQRDISKIFNITPSVISEIKTCKARVER